MSDNPKRGLEAALRALCEIEYREYLCECGCPDDQIEAEMKTYFAKMANAARQPPHSPAEAGDQ